MSLNKKDSPSIEPVNPISTEEADEANVNLKDHSEIKAGSDDKVDPNPERVNGILVGEEGEIMEKNGSTVALIVGIIFLVGTSFVWVKRKITINYQISTLDPAVDGFPVDITQITHMATLSGVGFSLWFITLALVGFVAVKYGKRITFNTAAQISAYIVVPIVLIHLMMFPASSQDVDHKGSHYNAEIQWLKDRYGLQDPRISVGGISPRNTRSEVQGFVMDGDKTVGEMEVRDNRYYVMKAGPGSALLPPTELPLVGDTDEYVVGIDAPSSELPDELKYKKKSLGYVF